MRFSLIFLVLTLQGDNINPLSKININSDNATFNKKNDAIQIQYKDNVKVTLADQSTIKSNILDILLSDLSQTGTLTPNFQKISFKGSVEVKQKNRSARSNFVEVYPNKKLCKLIGNVVVEQQKQNENDIPLITESKIAILDLKSNKISFLGDKLKPVSTTITIENHRALNKHEQNKNIINTRSTKNSSRRSR